MWGGGGIIDLGFFFRQLKKAQRKKEGDKRKHKGNLLSPVDGTSLCCSFSFSFLGLGMYLFVLLCLCDFFGIIVPDLHIRCPLCKYGLDSIWVVTNGGKGR